MIKTRETECKRTTKETDVYVKVNLDGQGKADISTGIGFFDHMLTAFAVHSGFDIAVRVKGDVEVDCHHTVEDTGIVLGKAIGDALGDKKGIARFAHCYIPMDDALARCVLDVSGRSFCVFEAAFQFKKCGDYDVDTTEEFFRALACNAEVTLHAHCLYGANDHHKTEALYKAAAHCFRLATRVTGGKILSSKEML